MRGPYLTTFEEEKVREIRSKREKFICSIRNVIVGVFLWLLSSFLIIGIVAHIPKNLAGLIITLWIFAPYLLVFYFFNVMDKTMISLKERTFILFAGILIDLTSYSKSSESIEISRVKSKIKNFLSVVSGETFKNSGFNFDKNKAIFYRNLRLYLRQILSELDGVLKTTRQNTLLKEIQTLKKYLENEEFIMGVGFLKERVKYGPSKIRFFIDQSRDPLITITSVVCSAILISIIFSMTIVVIGYDLNLTSILALLGVSSAISVALKEDIKKLFPNIFSAYYMRDKEKSTI